MERRTFKWAKVALGGLVICTFVLVVAGILSLFSSIFPIAGLVLKGVCILAFAGIAGFALFIAQAATACAQALGGTENQWARRVAWGCAVVCGMVSVAGVYLGDGIIRGVHAEMPPVQLMIAGGFVIGFIKPAMSFVIAACDSKEASRASAVDDLLAAKDITIRELQRQLRDLEKALQAKAVATSARASGHQARALAAALKSEQPKLQTRRLEPAAEERPAAEPRDVTLQEIEAACRKIMERKDEEGAPLTPSMRLVASQLETPRSRIEKALTLNQTRLALVVEKLAA